MILQTSDEINKGITDAVTDTISAFLNQPVIQLIIIFMFILILVMIAYYFFKIRAKYFEGNNFKKVKLCEIDVPIL